MGGKFVPKFFNVQLVILLGFINIIILYYILYYIIIIILGFWLEIRNNLITLKMPSSNTTAVDYIRTEIQ